MTAPLGEEYLAEVEARAAAATRGPWLRHGYSLAYLDPEDGEEIHLGYFDGPEADVAFMARARTDVPALLAEVARQRKTIMRLTEGAGAGVQRVRMYELDAGGWRVRYMLDGHRKATTCATEDEAKWWVQELSKRNGGAS